MSKKKYSLTEEHRAQLKPWADKWIAIAMSTKESTVVEQMLCEKAARGLYVAAALPEPKHVVFAKSPLVATIAAGVAAGVIYLRNNPDQQKKLLGRFVTERELMGSIAPACAFAVQCGLYRTEHLEAPPAGMFQIKGLQKEGAAATDDATRAATRDATDDATYAATYAATYDATDDATYAATRAATDDATYAATRAATRAATYAATYDATHDATYDATYDATDDATYAATHDATYDATYDATDDATYAATRDATDDATYDATDDATYAATRAATDDATRDATYAATRAATYDATRAATYAATRAATYDATRAATDDATRDATRAATYAATRAATYDATRAATDDATRDATRAATDDATRAATRAATRDATDDATYAATYDATRDANLIPVRDVARFLVQCVWRAWYMRNGGNQWAGWVSYLSFFRHVAKLDLDYSKWEHYETLGEHGGPRLMHKDFCIVSDRPEVLRVDERNRPHCANGPSHRWRDGWELHYWHGVRVTRRMIMAPESYTREEILAIRNTETRRVLAERLGWPAYLEKLGGAVVSTWEDPSTKLAYELLELKETGERILRKQSPELKDGSQPWYAEPVHIDLQTAQAARKWQAITPFSSDARETARLCNKNPILAYQVEA